MTTFQLLPSYIKLICMFVDHTSSLEKKTALFNMLSFFFFFDSGLMSLSRLFHS